jgi:hypothetical protein
MSASIRWQPITEEQGRAIQWVFPGLNLLACSTESNDPASHTATSDWGIPGAGLATLRTVTKFKGPIRLTTQYYIALVQAVEE